MSALRDEMKSEFKKTLTKAESDRLDELTKNLDAYQKEYSDTSIERLNLETQKQNLEQEIRTTLYPRRDQLKSRSLDEDDEHLDERRNELETLKRNLNDILARQKTAQTEVDKLAKSLRENQAKLSELQVCAVSKDEANSRLLMLKLPVRSRETKKLSSKVWQNERICYINAMNVIRVFVIWVCCLKRLMRNTKTPTPQRHAA
jgi:chromosome segregation ATPase